MPAFICSGVPFITSAMVAAGAMYIAMYFFMELLPHLSPRE
jgi:hypothetical protein